MNPDVITVAQCLQVMETGEPFACVVVSYDRKRRELSGEIREIPEAALLMDDEAESPLHTSPRPATRLEALKAEVETDYDNRDPKHSMWYTRNVRILSEGQPTAMIRKLHPPLLVEFNGVRVVP